MKLIKSKGIILLAGILAAASAHADDKFNINGFGHQDYRQANANSLDGADQRGTWNNNFFGVVMSAKVTDRDTAWAQIETAANQITRFTWAFVDHRFTDDLSAHVGRVKFPYGIYGEYVDNSWLQVTAVVPSIYNAAADMVYDSYNGIGLDWTKGSLFTQVYTGQVYNPNFGGTTTAYTPPINVAPTSDRRLLGGRVTWTTPVEGLRLLVSATQIQVESTAVQPTLGPLGKEYHALLSADYVTDKFDIKSEYSTHGIPSLTGYSGVASKAWYVQGGYKIDLWMPYVRYDEYQADQRYTSDPSYYQRDMTVGVNYKIADNINARIEDHVIHGYGLPVSAGETPAGGGQTNWNLFAAEVSFVF